MTHQFLSEGWITAARGIREKYQDEAPMITVTVKVNQVITEVPFGDGVVKSYVDTSSGEVVMELGELPDADATVTTDYETARKIFVEQDQQAAMQAFMSGKIKVVGDIMKVMGMQTAVPQTDITQLVAAEIKSITA
jgi:putative sterol carrier protein